MEYGPQNISPLDRSMFSNLKSNTGHQIVVRAEFAKPASANLVLKIQFLFLLSPPHA